MVYNKCTKDLQSYYSTLIASACTRVFGEEPWNEHKVCKLCKKKFGIHSVEQSTDDGCKHEFEDFWKTGALVNKVAQAFKKEFLSMWVCQDPDTSDVVGFAWAFLANPSDVCTTIDNKAKKTLLSYPSDTKVSYQAAVGVLKTYRQKGIAKYLYKKRHRDMVDMGAQLFVVRTETSSPMYAWLIKMGYSVVDDYKRDNADDNRVILAAELDQLKL